MAAIESPPSYDSAPERGPVSYDSDEALLSVSVGAGSVQTTTKKVTGYVQESKVGDAFDKPAPKQAASAPRYKDLWATVLFLCFIAGFLALAAVAAPRGISAFGTAGSKSKTSAAGTVAAAVCAGIAGALTLSVTWFALLMRFPGPVIKGSYFAFAGLLFAAGVYSAVVGLVGGAIVWLIFGGLFLATYWQVLSQPLRYYFLGVQQPDEALATISTTNPTLKSAKRAMTSSFGPICFGSLISSVVHTLQTLARAGERNAAENDNPLLCLTCACLSCLLGCIEGYLKFFNKYAFVQVAMHGKSYCEAGRDSWELFSRVGMEVIINDTITTSVLAVASVAAALLSAFIAYIVAFASPAGASLPQTAGAYASLACIAGLLGFWLSGFVLEVVASGVATTFVCLAQDPMTLKTQQPALYESIRTAWPDLALWSSQL
ncbi:putative choline transporter, neither null mutation nor overexpression affects choline transport, partial [Cladochytrium tenue]